MKKTAIITGASRGIGKQVAIHLATQNFHTHLIAKSRDLLDQVQNEITAIHGSTTIHPIDIRNESEIVDCIDNIATNENIDFLFNNAGVSYMGTSIVNKDQFQEMIDVNLVANITIANAVAKHMKQQCSGYIVNMCSFAAKEIGIRSKLGIYSASKFGLLGYSLALYNELIDYDVKVTALSPNYIPTDITKNVPINPEEMIQVTDILKTLDYLLSLSSNAVMREIVIECREKVKRQNK